MLNYADAGADSSIRNFYLAALCSLQREILEEVQQDTG